ncbi:hypothetical protein LB516_23980 [Mesorhizobium sp. CO1-1-7]|uniref:hypothetical protein n=1 Tax=Mesorhizobium sp. CO1-1-7 TaxID=2876632 RepID=UPI001CD189E3|nr:hypothetical protein [Mesorhizobium sp. CO1-1-7]MBZ9748294.1 hypothetical protein [Mesorhizobium sp. CO1-1-7]
MKTEHHPECGTLTEAYARQGATVRNPRRTWSMVTDDGKAVVVTLWTDRFLDVEQTHYSTFGLSGQGWIDRPENRRRIEHLQQAMSNRGGLFRSIIVTPSDAMHSSIVARKVGPEMRVTKIDEATGRFEAERA